PSSELQEWLSRQFHQVQLLLCDDVQRVWPPAEDAELAEVVSRTDRARHRPHHLRLAAQNQVEGVGAGSGRADSLAPCMLGERRVADELAQVPLADSGEERERREHVGPVAVRGSVFVAQRVHHAASCSGRWANGWGNASGARSPAKGKRVAPALWG